GWQILQKDQYYSPDNLYEYIYGGAELYLSYGFQKVFSRIYNKPDQPEIIVDIFDMKNSYNAFGVFAFSREKEDSSFGQGSQYVPGLLLFWKDRYYISILFSPETEESKEAAFIIARHIESSIHKNGPLPEILKLLPEDSLLTESIRYFRHYTWINSYRFISNENILNINDSTEAVMAKYDYDNNKPLLLLIQYPDKSECKTARDAFIEGYFEELAGNPIVKKEDEWVGYTIYGNVLAIVFNGKNKKEVDTLLNKVRHKI
ncbi:MAG: hypothetical protein P8X42_16740, partial [Calditrichaceae bacterium]